jgi:hypothetical protein
MAYVEKYYLKWVDHLGVNHEIKLLQDGASAGTYGIPQVGVKACSIRRRGSKTAILESNIIGSELEANFYVDDSEIAGIDAMFESNFKDWIVQKYYNGVMEWVGYLKPDNFTRTYIKKGRYWAIRLSATDALATLKSIEYVDASDGSQYNDRATVMETIKRALEHLGFELDFEVQMNTWCSNDSLMTANDLFFDKGDVDNARYTQNKDGREVNEDCHTIIDKTIKDFNCYLLQMPGATGPVYRLYNPQEKNSNNFYVAWSDLSLSSASPVSNDLRVNITDFNFITAAELQKIRPFEAVEVTYNDRNVQDNLLSNGDFSSGGTGWNSSSGWYSGFNTTSGYLKQPGVLYGDSGFDEDPLYVYTDNEAITKNADGDLLSVKFKYRINSVSPVGSEVFMKVRIYDGSTEYSPSAQSPVTGNIALNEGTLWQLYEGTWSFPGSVGTNNFSLRIYCFPKTGGPYYDGHNFEIDDVYWVPIYVEGDDTTFDQFWKINNTDDEFTDTHEDTLYFGDAKQDNDIGGYHISGTRTKTWNRYGKTENASIQTLFAQNIIENYARYKDYVRLVIFDYDYDIKPDTIIQMNNDGLGLKDYQVLGWVIDYVPTLPPRIECEVQEVLNAAVGVSILRQDLTSVDGESAGGSVSIQASGGGVTIDDGNTRTDATWSSSKISSELAAVSSLWTEESNGDIYYNGGNVAIGTDSPVAGYQMTVYDTGACALFQRNAATGTIAAFLSTSGMCRFEANSGYTNKLYINSLNSAGSAYQHFGIKTGNGEPKFSFRTDGSLRIGTTNSAELAENTTSTYGNLALGGTARGGYYGIRIGATTHASLTSSASIAGLYWDDTNEWGVRTDKNASVYLYYNGAYKLQTTNTGITVVGAVVATGEVESYDTSDIRIKMNIEHLDKEVVTRELMKLSTIKYDHKIKKKREIGLIAQEVQRAFPEVVKEDDEGVLMIQYGKLIAPLLAMIQKQEKRIKKLEKELR